MKDREGIRCRTMENVGERRQVGRKAAEAIDRRRYLRGIFRNRAAAKVAGTGTALEKKFEERGMMIMKGDGLKKMSGNKGYRALQLSTDC